LKNIYKKAFAGNENWRAVRSGRNALFLMQVTYCGIAKHKIFNARIRSWSIAPATDFVAVGQADAMAQRNAGRPA
jgi:hypothetical protein